MEYDLSSAEKLGFQILDQCHFLFFPEKWLELFEDYSKNDFMALVLIYRNGEVTMTDVAEYIKAPLNTATGVISRLEKREVVSRQRSKEDRRVVTVALTAKGKMEIKEVLSQVNTIFSELLGEIDKSDAEAVLRIVDKTIGILNKRMDKEKPKRINKIEIM